MRLQKTSEEKLLTNWSKKATKEEPSNCKGAWRANKAQTYPNANA